MVGDPGGSKFTMNIWFQNGYLFFKLALDVYKIFISGKKDLIKSTLVGELGSSSEIS